MLKRSSLLELEEWSSRSNRKPMVIRGARQVGKTTLAREFARTNDFVLVEVNFERNPEYREAFATNDPQQILNALTLVTGQAIVPGKTVIFLDEIQNAPEALVALRYIFEELPALHIIAAGSLLDITLGESPISMPVGRIESLFLGPVSFEEYLGSRDGKYLASCIGAVDSKSLNGDVIPPIAHRKLLECLREYLCIGGLPEAMATYLQTFDFTEVSRIQQNVLSTFRDDFHKYRGRRSEYPIQRVFEAIPQMAGRKFKFANVSRELRTNQVSNALELLCRARVVDKVHHSSGNGVPLAGEIKQNHFKCIFLDVGLMGGALNRNLVNVGRLHKILSNEGAIAEQFIGQHLLHRHASFIPPELFYWVRESRSSNAEVDYVIDVGSIPVPVEVKAGKTGTLKSLHQFLSEKKRTIGLRFNLDKPSFLRHSSKLSNGQTVEYSLLSLPLYMVQQSVRLLESLSSE